MVTSARLHSKLGNTWRDMLCSTMRSVAKLAYALTMVGAYSTLHILRFATYVRGYYRFAPYCLPGNCLGERTNDCFT